MQLGAKFDQLGHVKRNTCRSGLQSFWVMLNVYSERDAFQLTRNSSVLEPSFVCAAIDGTHLTMEQQM